MRDHGDGRFCERCRLRVTEVAKLDDAELERVIEAAASERVCVRFELDHGRPRTALGIAAGLVVVALAGCATPIPEPPATQEHADASFDWGEGAGAVIAGRVSDPSGASLANAIVILQSPALPTALERYTNERGIYQFADLPPGDYTIQVLAGRANVSKIVTMPADARFRANFAVDPDQDRLMGVIVEPSTFDGSPASSYSSSLIEYE